MWGKNGGQWIQVLIDSGSTHNFLKPEVAERLKIPIESVSPFRVYVGNGDSLLCDCKATQVPVELQGTAFQIDFYILAIKGPEMVLGMPWLQKLGRVTHDYKQMTMEFRWEEKNVILQGNEDISPRKVSCH
ncbi:hypothetical protein C2S52_000663 [Perilla frutescens var. hirtella]|nr:hypothetical protein C2S52_000663 [Perilla frutescens var. hirtella]